MLPIGLAPLSLQPEKGIACRRESCLRICRCDGSWHQQRIFAGIREFPKTVCPTLESLYEGSYCVGSLLGAVFSETPILESSERTKGNCPAGALDNVRSKAHGVV